MIFSRPNATSSLQERVFAAGWTSWVAAFILLAITGVIVPALIAAHFGAMSIPSNDDWSYILSSYQLADSGTLNSFGWVTINLVGQLSAAVPVIWIFGHHIAPLRFETLTIGFLALLATFDLGQRLLSAPRALFIAVIVSIGPLWAVLTASFMTDIPGMACGLVCLALGARSLEHQSLRPLLFASALIVGVAGFSIREYAIVAPIAVCLAALCVFGKTPGRRVALGAILLGVLVVCLGIYVWRQRAGLPGHGLTSPLASSALPVANVIEKIKQYLIFIGLAIAPVVALANPRQCLRKSFREMPGATFLTAVITVGVLAGEAGTQSSTGNILGPGNYLLSNGILGNDLIYIGHRPNLFAPWVLITAAVIGIASVTIAMCVLIPAVIKSARTDRMRYVLTPQRPTVFLLGLAAIGYGLTCGIPGLLGQPAFDRYALPLLPIIAILVLAAADQAHITQRYLIICATSLAIVLAGFSAIYALNYASFTSSLWKLDAQIAPSAPSAHQFNGGVVWNSYVARKFGGFHPTDTCIEVINVAPRTRVLADANQVIGVKHRHPIQRVTVLATVPVWGPWGIQEHLAAVQTGACRPITAPVTTHK